MKDSNLFYIVIPLGFIAAILMGMQLEDFWKEQTIYNTISLILMFISIPLICLAIGIAHKEIMKKEITKAQEGKRQ